MADAKRRTPLDSNLGRQPRALPQKCCHRRGPGQVIASVSVEYIYIYIYIYEIISNIMIIIMVIVLFFIVIILLLLITTSGLGVDASDVISSDCWPCGQESYRTFCRFYEVPVGCDFPFMIGYGVRV